MAGYTKLFSSIVHSTIWREADHIRIVWITMLALADKHGIVGASIPGLADVSRVSLEQCEEALEKLLSPDKYSRSQEFEGRRIKPVQGGWLVLNYERYRGELTQDKIRRQTRERVQKHRERKDSQCDDTVSNVTQCNACNAQSEAYADADRVYSELNQADSLQPNSNKHQSVKPGSNEPRRARPKKTEYTKDFLDWWTRYPRKVGKQAAFRSFQRQRSNMPSIMEMLEKLALQASTQQWQRDGGQFIPHPVTYLNQGRWDDEINDTHFRRPESPQERRKRESDMRFAEMLERATQRDLARARGEYRGDYARTQACNGDSLFGELLQGSNIVGRRDGQDLVPSAR